MTITNCDSGSVAVELGGTAEGLLKNTVAAVVTFAKGTILTQHEDLKLYPWTPASVAGDIGLYVLTYDVQVAASLEAAVTVLAAGKINQNRLRIHDGSSITGVHLAALRDFAITPIDVEQLGSIDNPQVPS